MSVVEYSVENNVGYILLNRPDKRNAINREMFDELEKVIDSAENDNEVKVVVLKGAGDSFSSGWDLKDSYYLWGPEGMQQWDLGTASSVLRRIEALYMKIWNLRVPTVAQIKGHAIAAGCYLQLVCDISVAAEDAIFGHPVMQWGGVSSMPLWQVLLGPKKARYLLYTSRTIDGKEAERMGLVTMTVPREELESTVNGIVDDMLRVPTEGLRHHKEVLNTDLEIMGLGTMYRFHGQHNAFSRVYGYK
jgi:enoyl-CoA hydratase